MTSAANQDAYGSRGWNQGPWGNTQGPQWQQPNNGPPWGNHGVGQPMPGPARPSGIRRASAARRPSPSLSSASSSGGRSDWLYSFT